MAWAELSNGMDWRLILEFLVIAGALAMGARMGGVGLGLWGAMGLLVLVVGFDVAPANIPGEVLIIVLTVIMAASAMEVAGGIDFLVRIAERIIRRNPKQITVIAPLVTYGFTFAAGTGHIVYPLLPVIYEVAHENGIRPERSMAIAVIASQQAITASPVSAATAAMIGLLAPHHIGLVQILIICVPSTLIAVFIASLVQLRVGKELKDDPEYQKRRRRARWNNTIRVVAKRALHSSPARCAVRSSSSWVLRSSCCRAFSRNCGPSRARKSRSFSRCRSA